MQPVHPAHANPNLHVAHQNAAPPQQQPRPVGPDLIKLRAEIARLDLQVKKLQTELQIERQYNQALEAQLQAFTHSE
jgi:hypothetical protein